MMMEQLEESWLIIVEKETVYRVIHIQYMCDFWYCWVSVYWLLHFCCRAPARTSWTTSCTFTGLCPSPSWPSVWSRCLLHTPADRGSLRWGKCRFKKKPFQALLKGLKLKFLLYFISFFSFKGCLTDIHMVKDSWQTCNLSHSPKWFIFFCTEGIGFVKLMRFAGYLFLCLSAFPVSLQKSFTSCFTLKQTIDVLFYLFCLINLPWVSEVLRSTWIRKSRNLCSGL